MIELSLADTKYTDTDTGEPTKQELLKEVIERFTAFRYL